MLSNLRRKNLIRAVMVVGLVLTSLIPISVCAADNTASASVGVQYVDLLDAPDSVRAVVVPAEDTDDVNVAILQTSPALIRYSHNSTITKMITATASPRAECAVGLTLRLAVEGESEVVLVDAGKPLSDVVVWNDIAAGGYTRSITWTIDYVGDTVPTQEPIIWNVFFTSCDVQ